MDWFRVWEILARSYSSAISVHGSVVMQVVGAVVDVQVRSIKLFFMYKHYIIKLFFVPFFYAGEVKVAEGVRAYLSVW